NALFQSPSPKKKNPSARSRIKFDLREAKRTRKWQPVTRKSWLNATGPQSTVLVRRNAGSVASSSPAIPAATGPEVRRAKRKKKNIVSAPARTIGTRVDQTFPPKNLKIGM